MKRRQWRQQAGIIETLGTTCAIFDKSLRSFHAGRDSEAQVLPLLWSQLEYSCLTLCLAHLRLFNFHLLLVISYNAHPYWYEMTEGVCNTYIYLLMLYETLWQWGPLHK